MSSETNGIAVFKKGTSNRSIVVIPIAGRVYIQVLEKAQVYYEKGSKECSKEAEFTKNIK